MSTILVTTPTGHIGSRVVSQLLDAGASVRVFVRDPARLPVDMRGRVDARTGTLEDTAALTDALRGVDVAFLLVPPNMTADDWPAFYRQIGHNMADASRAAGLRRAVLLSSLGAHRPDLGPVTALGQVEEILKPVIPDLAILRPGYFFENTFAALGTVPQTGSIFGAQPGDLAFPQVATQDIGDVAARWLLDASWSGHPVIGIHGPRDLSLEEQARLIGEAVGREVRYVEVPPDTIAEAMRGMGMSPSVVASYREMITGYAASRYERPEARTPETTTPTEFADWARAALRPAFEAAAARGGSANA